jgi:hypothetical protein
MRMIDGIASFPIRIPGEAGSRNEVRSRNSAVVQVGGMPQSLLIETKFSEDANVGRAC